ncbi:hypothetical protein JCGZ_25342 [Jatropha curcas]|uniref:Uncharacterized protein n=1 Tax=Jatropha curcas TaxID=180498 RepID=A0A067JWM4_JATCU|nr:hypothetical protein JCGZ_25342 [Jatropha curcas]
MAHPLTCAPGSQSLILADRSNPHMTSPLIVFPFSLLFSIRTGGNPVVSIQSRSSDAYNRRPPCGLQSNLDYQIARSGFTRAESNLRALGLETDDWSGAGAAGPPETDAGGGAELQQWRYWRLCSGGVISWRWRYAIWSRMKRCCWRDAVAWWRDAGSPARRGSARFVEARSASAPSPAMELQAQHRRREERKRKRKEE